MPGPVATEQAFRTLTATLACPASPSWHLHAVARFFDRLDPTRPEAEAYLLELAGALGRLTNELDPAGWRPEALHELLVYLERAREHAPVLQEVAALGQAIADLNDKAALAWAWGGRLDHALTVLLDDVPPGTALDAITGGAALSPRKRLEHAVEATAHGTVHHERLVRLAECWDRALPEDRFGVLVPVVEVPAVDRTHDPRPTLRRVRVEVFRRRGDEDRLRLDAATYGLQGTIEREVEVPVRAARRLLAETRPGLRHCFFEGQASFARPQALHEGRSASLALAVLFYMAVLRQGEQRLRYRMQRGACLTGDVTEEGRVEPVEGLALKVQAAFFSGVTCLAVPEAQRTQAVAERDRWQARYPARWLDVVGVAHLREVFYDRRLVAEERIGAVRHGAQWLWRRKGSVGSLTIIAGLVVALGLLLYGPIDRNPVAAEFDVGVIRFINEHGAALHEAAVDKRMVNFSPGDQKRLVALYDVDGDGINEMFWIDKRKDQASVMYAQRLGDDAPLWRQEMHFEFRYPHKPEVTQTAFRAFEILIDDVDRDGEGDVLVAARHTLYFPAVVLRLDARTGALEEKYVHPGFFSDMLLADLTGDGRQELVLLGVNNAFDHEPVLVVLDPRRILGHGPQTTPYTVEGYERAQEMAYVRFPRTEIGERLRHRRVPANRRLLKHGDYLDAEVVFADVQGSTARDADRHAWLIITLDRQLRPVQVGTSNAHDILTRQLVAQGVLEHVPGPAYYERYMQTFQYWNGDGWQTKPTWNRRWLAANDSLAALSRP